MFFILLLVGLLQSAQPEVGVVVTRVRPGGAGEMAGLQPNDILLSWQVVEAQPNDTTVIGTAGVFSSPLYFEAVEVERSSRDAVRFEILRDGQKLSLELPSRRWRTDTRPLLSDARAAIYNKAMAQINADPHTLNVAPMDRLIAELEAEGTPYKAIALLADTADWLHWGSKKYDEALPRYQTMVEKGEDLEDAWVQARAYRDMARLYGAKNDLEAQKASFKRGIDIMKAQDPKGMRTIYPVIWLGNVLHTQGKHEEAAVYYRWAYDVCSEVMPGSFTLAGTVINLGLIAFYKGDMSNAERFYRESHSLLETLIPDSIHYANAKNNVGNVLLERGKLAEADRFYREALALKEKLKPGSIEVSHSLVNLGKAALARLDPIAADSYVRRALEIQNKLVPDSVELGPTYSVMGKTSLLHGDKVGALTWFEKAIENHRRYAPDSIHLAATLFEHTELAIEIGQLKDAIAYCQEALAIRREKAPMSLAVADSMSQLARLEAKHDSEEARCLWGEAAQIYTKLAPGSMNQAAIFRDLGQNFLAKQQPQQAAYWLWQALDIQEKLVPDSLPTAMTYHAIAKLHRHIGQRQEAIDPLERAMAALEQQTHKMGRTEDVQSLRLTDFKDIYRDAIDLYLELDRVEQALGTTERYYARTFLNALKQRDLDLSQQLPEGMEDRYRELTAALAKLTSAFVDQGQVGENMATQINQVRQERAILFEEIKRNSPEWAALRKPQPLNSKEIHQALEEGILLVAFAVMPDRTHIFTARRHGKTQVTTLTIGQETLQKLVRDMRLAITKPKAAWAQKQLDQTSFKLFELLIQPLMPQIKAAKRLMLIPDGPLHQLPFHALKSTKKGDASGYLIETVPMFFANSVSSYQALGQRQRDQNTQAWIGIGDPKYGSKEPMPKIEAEKIFEDMSLASIHRGGQLEPLPFSRVEIERIAPRFGARGQVLLGEAASEIRVKTLEQADVVHFSCHAIVDERYPLLSALVLTDTNDKEDGYLQAWEIMENMKLNADLVVLSACNTGLGKNAGSEGLLGLTRAFFYAGANAVLASLWQVSDLSTAVLMDSFYQQHVDRQKSVDEALQAAQVAFIQTAKEKDQALAHPFYWAGFQTYGTVQDQ